jgi:hypothetical protein
MTRRYAVSRALTSRPLTAKSIQPCGQSYGAYGKNQGIGRRIVGFMVECTLCSYTKLYN